MTPDTLDALEKRLRDSASIGASHPHFTPIAIACVEGAAAIAALRGEVAKWEETNRQWEMLSLVELMKERDALRAEVEALKAEGIARLEREDRAIVTDEMLALFNNESAFCGFHGGLWSYKCPVCREWQRRATMKGGGEHGQ